MGLSLVTGPTVEPVTLAEAKAHCRVVIAEDDALLSGYIQAARERVEAETRRAIITQTWDQKFDFDWPRYLGEPDENHRRCWEIGITLQRPPLQSVTSISYVDTQGATQTLAADQYQVVKRNGQSGDGLIVPAYGVTWPQVRDIPDAITVRFVAGYGGLESVPGRVRQAMLLMIGDAYENRENQVTGTIVTALPAGADRLLETLRVF